MTKTAGPISDGLADKLAFPGVTASVDHDEACRLGLVAVHELIEFDILIDKLLHIIGTTSKRVD